MAVLCDPPADQARRRIGEVDETETTVLLVLEILALVRVSDVPPTAILERSHSRHVVTVCCRDGEEHPVFATVDARHFENDLAGSGPFCERDRRSRRQIPRGQDLLRFGRQMSSDPAVREREVGKGEVVVGLSAVAGRGEAGNPRGAVQRVPGRRCGRAGYLQASTLVFGETFTKACHQDPVCLEHAFSVRRVFRGADTQSPITAVSSGDNQPGFGALRRDSSRRSLRDAAATRFNVYPPYRDTASGDIRRETDGKQSWK